MSTLEPAIFIKHLTFIAFSRFLGGRTRNLIIYTEVIKSNEEGCYLKEASIRRAQSDDLLGVERSSVNRTVEFQVFESDPSFCIHWQNVFPSHNFLNNFFSEETKCLTYLSLPPSIIQSYFKNWGTSNKGKTKQAHSRFLFRK